MERERSRQEQTADTDKLYPQIAEALNISISQLEQYPSDMKQILCQAYINNCELGKDDVAEALNGIVNLDVDEVGIKEVEKQQDNTAVDNELRQTEVTERKNKRSYLLSRNQILQNARTIADSDKSKQYDRQQPENLTVLIMLAIRYTNLSHTKLLNRSRTNFLSDKPKCSKKANRAVQNTYIRINM